MRMSQKFCNITVYANLQCVNHVTEVVQALVSTIMIVCVLALLHSV